MTPITDIALRKAKPQDKPYKIAAGNGLYLLVNPIGSKLWRWKYRVAGKEKLLALGAYPTLSLQDARQRCEDARRRLALGEDPAETRKAQKAAKARAEVVAADTFERVAREWMAAREAKGDTAETTGAKDRWRLESYLFPYIGQRPITEITALELRDVLRKAEDAGKRETASRVKINAGQVFRWAVLEGRTHSDITASLRGLFTTPKPTHRATITDPKLIGELLRAIDGYTGQFVTLSALKLAPLVFVRPGELRQAAWNEFDLDQAMWRIPGERMKMKAAHLVPLSAQAVDVLRELHKLTGHGHFGRCGHIRRLLRPVPRKPQERQRDQKQRRGDSGDDLAVSFLVSVHAHFLEGAGQRTDLRGCWTKSGSRMATRYRTLGLPNRKSGACNACITPISRRSPATATCYGACAIRSTRRV